MLLFTLALVATLCAWAVTVAETAFIYLPHHRRHELIHEHPHTILARVLERVSGSGSEKYTHPLRLVRILATATVAVALMLALVSASISRYPAAVATVVIIGVVGYPLISVGAVSLGRSRPGTILRVLAGFVHYTTAVFRPVTGALDILARAVAPRRMRQAPAGVFAEEELREFLDRASDAETIEGDEAQIMQSVFDLDDTRIGSIMVPRTDMLTVERNENIQNALSLFLRSGYSRIPVIGDSTDDILGILYLKDVVLAQLTGAEAQLENQEPSITALMRPAHFEPDSKRVMEMLRYMQRESTHVAIVVDEYGGTAGMITLEDIIEELVGDISDEYDSDKPEYALQEDGSFKVSARLGVDELGEIFGVDLEDEEVDTVGGLVAKQLGKVPIVGSEVQVENIRIRAVHSSGRRHQIDTLLAWTPNEEQTDSAGS